ncbi:UvrD-helicase domain-containing protein [Kriegella aquimaris]|uniref:UvrD-helicase domain-containing protein n=1 Tax=Kriegella aquimaris TaxID=192904 RepID=UPI001FDF8F8E|nr:UvrD-helicase domain-containing protein [Kriegella aquimaris]
MQQKSVQDTPFKIYNASAGSGKTYTLTKEYLKIALTSQKRFQTILAITFTNKAVNEMKGRILDSLFHFSLENIPHKSQNMFDDLASDLKISPSNLREKSQRTLKEILHNYAFFDVSTIDKFTHRLIRTFAKDLKLPQNFEPVIDTALLQEEAVARVIQKAGIDKLLTQVLVDFALEKTDDNRSWDVAFDLNEISKLLFNENHVPHLDKIKNKSISDFILLKQTIKIRLAKVEKEITANAILALAAIEDNGLVFSDFSSSYFPKFMLKISQNDFNIDFNAGWKRNFETAPLYAKSCADSTKIILDGLHPQFIEYFSIIKNRHSDYLFLKNAYQNVVPLTVLNVIQKEINAIGEEQDQIPLFKFNHIISNEIKNQPAPFIYERLGEKYRHYFIDEFQDTSEMQWNNLVPLVDNALTSLDDQGKIGSLFLVGDAKQAIYRWRGGNAEQFLGLVNQRANPFVIDPGTENLPINFRSHEEIIKFNNDFFSSVISFLERPEYHALFAEGNQQRYNSKKGGFVRLDFVVKEDEEQIDENYCRATLEIIHDVVNKNYVYNDICILVRSNSKGILLANYLTQQEIPIISSESLLLASSSKVRFLIHLLYYSGGSQEADLAYEILSFLSADEALNRHHYISSHLDDLKSLLKEVHDFDIDHIKQSSVYDAFELAIKQFDLAPESDAYITFLMDVVLEVEQKEGGNAQSFLDYWEKKQDKLAITAPENMDAVRIMTVHKSKGLEFPIVIFPFANMDMFRRNDKKLWLPVDSASYNGFDEVLVNEKSEVAEYSDIAKVIFEEEEQKMVLDAFNVLYVALTRAEKALFVLTEKEINKSGGHNTKHYSGLFIHYLKELGVWEDSKNQYTFGDLNMAHLQKDHLTKPRTYIQHYYSYKNRPSFNIITRSGVLWDTQREEALFRGNLIHYILGLIETEKDVDRAFNDLIRNGDITPDETGPLKSRIYKIIKHPELLPYYQEGNTILNEKDILTKTGSLLRPDRIVITENKATIIDYKTGKKNSKYQDQVYAYAAALETMGYFVENKIIVYIEDNVTPEFI